MDTYIKKVVTKVVGKYKAIRSRASDGSCRIEVWDTDANYLMIELLERDNYEDEARKILKALKAVVDNPCLLPKEERL